MRRLVSLGLSFLLLAAAIGCAVPEAPQASQPPLPQPEPVGLSSDEEVFDALDTEALLDIGYSEPDRVVIVEGVVDRGFYAEKSKGSPTFLDFHDPYEDWFKCVIWCEDKETLEPVRDRFMAAFPPDPETYFLNKRVRVSGEINIYKGTPEIILTDPAQIWVVSEAGEYEVLVSRVIDGDTIEVLGGERIRYIGIDAPETGEYFAAEAVEKNRELVEGKRVRLESDVEDRDEYGRLLSYVWLDDIMVNAELVRLGCAYSYSLVPNVKYRQLFLQLEREARKLRRGLWVE